MNKPLPIQNHLEASVAECYKNKNNDSSVILVLHEIYGINKFIRQICEDYRNLGYDVICPDLLKLGKSFEYSAEHEAYENFKSNVGFVSAAGQVKKLIAGLRNKYKHIFILGFSVGATIAWLCSDLADRCDGVIGYYGSRIRDYLDIKPTCKTLLIFAEEEKSFSAEELLSILNQNALISAYVLPGRHGFSDDFSKNYYAESSNAAHKLVNDFLVSQGGCQNS